MEKKLKLPGRPRDESAREAILHTSLELAIAHGYTQVTLLDIAAKAGVARSTIYRWWPSKSRLYLEAVFYQFDHLVTASSTDIPLQVYVTNLIKIVREKTGAITIALLLEAQHDPELRDTLYERLRQRRQLFRDMLERTRAQQKNARSDISTGILVDMLIGAIWYRHLYQFAPLDDDFADELIDAINVLNRH